MSRPDDGGAAYPSGHRICGSSTIVSEPGMSLRQFYAAHAGVEAITLLDLRYGNNWRGDSGTAIRNLAETKLAIADAMLAEREGD